MKRPVRDFLRDSEFYYKAVERHLRGCLKCSPGEALEGFLKNREKRQGGSTSQTIIRLALRIKAAHTDRVPDRIVSNFVAGGMISATEEFHANERWLDDQAWRRAEDVAYTRWFRIMRKAHAEAVKYRRSRSYNTQRRLHSVLQEDEHRFREVAPYSGFLRRVMEHKEDEDPSDPSTDAFSAVWRSELGTRILDTIGRVRRRAERETDPAIREIVGWMRVHEVLADD